MNKQKKIFVTGGTGFIGSYLLRYLVDRGYQQIRALRRTGSSMDLLGQVGGRIEWVTGDLLDSFSLEEALEGIEQVYHCAAVVSYDPAEKEQMMTVNVEGTANLVNAALHREVEKFVHVSSIAAIGRTREGEMLDETKVWQRGDYNTNYAISKFLSEQEVWRGMAEGLRVGIANPSVVLGSGRWNEGALRFFPLVWNNFHFYPTGGSGFVDVRDVARFLIRLMESEVDGQRYILNSENMPFEDLLRQIARQLDRPEPSVRVGPGWQGIAWRLARLAAAFNGKRPFLTRETAANASRTFYFDNSKSKNHFDFNYIPIRETIAAASRQFREAVEAEMEPKCLPLVAF